MEGGVEVEIAELITILCDCVCGFVMEKLCRNTKVKYFFLEREGADGKLQDRKDHKGPVPTTLQCFRA